MHNKEELEQKEAVPSDDGRKKQFLKNKCILTDDLCFLVEWYISYKFCQGHVTLWAQW